MAAMSYPLDDAFPTLAAALPRLPLGDWPTPLVTRIINIDGRPRRITIKCDDRSNAVYGGNKIRKLEYLLQRARDNNAKRVATFGTVASNHALATSLHANAQDLECTCFLSHQHRTRKAAMAINAHLAIGTELIPYGGSVAARRKTLRQHVQGRECYIIPMGGSNWLGTIGFVNAGLELFTQYEAMRAPPPDRIYIANGTMGSAAGLALGLALAGASTQVHAVRVTHDFVANETLLTQLLEKAVKMLRRYDHSIPAGLADDVRVTLHHGYFGDGYARSNAATDRAIQWARDELEIELEATYTGKAIAAMIDDLHDPASAEQSFLFWNTYSSAHFDIDDAASADHSELPEAFLRYF
ncbi:MAG: pyridoxal-phosphate dependent enzyme [Pseudomonadota bacterium]